MPAPVSLQQVSQCSMARGLHAFRVILRPLILLGCQQRAAGSFLSQKNQCEVLVVIRWPRVLFGPVGGGPFPCTLGKGASSSCGISIDDLQGLA